MIVKLLWENIRVVKNDKEQAVNYQQIGHQLGADVYLSEKTSFPQHCYLGIALVFLPF